MALYHGHIHRADELRAATVLEVLEAADAFRRPERLNGLLLASEADYRGRTNFEARAYPQAERFRALHAAAAEVDAGAVAAACRKPEQIGAAVRQARLAAIKQVRNGRIS